MNLTKLKNYAPAARNALITAVTRRAGTLGIQPGRVDQVTESGDVALIGGQPFPRSIVPLRKQLLDLIQREGFDHTMEAMAYTWFNRLAALRFMELHDGYLDHGYRVISHPQGTLLPEILQHAEHVSLKGLDREEVIRLKLDGNRDEELYRLLLLAQCAELNHILPDVFSKLDDATILLLPDNLLHSDSVIRQLVADSDAEDWQQVEILGWLYQFYISEKKDAVMARKSAVPTEDIPAVTQLFTPHWIVRYLVENSLGRLWLLNRPGSPLRKHMPYYIEGEVETNFLKISKPEEIRLCDPAVGSAHILTYAFDLLALIYEEEGYAANDIPGLILQHNLHGLDLCPRAAQLAELALVFKAREKSRRFFSPGNFVRPHIIELRDVRFADGELREYFHALGEQPSAISPNLVQLLHQFEEAKNFGSLIQPCLTESEIQVARLQIQNSKSNIQNSADLMVGATHLKVLRVLEQAEALTQRYHVVVENPPYCGSRYMNSAVANLAKVSFKEGSADMFAMFTLRSIELVKDQGHIAIVCPFVWMFIATYEVFRRKVLSSGTFESMVRLEYNAFEPACVPVSAWVYRKLRGVSKKCTFIDLSDFKGIEAQAPRTLEAIADDSVSYRFEADCSEFLKFPTAGFGYFVSAAFRDSFANNKKLGDVVEFTGSQNITGKNSRFVRLWWEIGIGTLGPSSRWVFYSKGGGNRKWWGLLEDVVDWSETARDFYKENKTSNLLDQRYWFKPGVTYSMLTSNQATFRLLPVDTVYDKGGPAFHPHEKEMELVLLALCNSPYADRVFDVLNPTLNLQVQDVKNLPLANIDKVAVCELTANCVDLARADWNNFETSWGFHDLPLLRPGLKVATLESSWRNWEAQSSSTIRRMQELETENNRLLISAYGLDGDLQPEVSEAQVTLARADALHDIAAFLSYAVGCMTGRYSLDHPGLILANAGDSLREFLEKVGKPLTELTFAPDEDGIIPVLDGEWFEDDVIARTKEFLRATFGEGTLAGNIAFIEASLGKDLRTYFQNDFYKDHLQTYQNRPIYWLFSSGKQKAFQCLVYIHRYTSGTLARIRTEYAIPLQGKLAARINRLEEEVTQTSSSAARKKLQADLDKAKKQMVELLAFDEQLRSYADQTITIDLDDGVKTNYAKFGPLVAESKKIYGTKDD